MELEHISVMKDEVLSFFREREIRRFLDATLGFGGHSEAMLQEHPEIQELIGFDQDTTALELAKKRLQPFQDKCRFIHTNFEAIGTATEGKFDGILLDIGVSSMQLDQAERGFSFMNDGPLDMRMNQQDGISAEEIVNSYREEEIANILYQLGEERKSFRVAKAIVEARRKKRITTTKELADIIERVLPRQGKMHPATRTFQALRIAVNRELECLTHVIPAAISCLNPGGRLVIISFHSLEDRIVKYAFRENTHIQILTKKPLEPSQEECKLNPRSRSAKLRAAELK